MRSRSSTAASFFYFRERTLVQGETIAAPPMVVLIPKNRGLAAMAQYALSQGAPLGRHECSYVRGEDVPLLADELARNGRALLAFTGDDLLDEWLASGRSLDQRIARRSLTWNDPLARYGKPALCLIGPRAAKLPDRGQIRVAVCAKYQNLARRYLRELERAELRITPVPISGSVEAALLHDVAEFMIDIVVTGKTIENLNLDVYAVIMTSDLALLEAGV